MFRKTTATPDEGFRTYVAAELATVRTTIIDLCHEQIERRLSERLAAYEEGLLRQQDLVKNIEERTSVRTTEQTKVLRFYLWTFATFLSILGLIGVGVAVIGFLGLSQTANLATEVRQRLQNGEMLQNDVRLQTKELRDQTEKQEKLVSDSMRTLESKEQKINDAIKASETEANVLKQKLSDMAAENTAFANLTEASLREAREEQIDATTQLLRSLPTVDEVSRIRQIASYGNDAMTMITSLTPADGRAKQGESSVDWAESPPASQSQGPRDVSQSGRLLLNLEARFYKEILSTSIDVFIVRPNERATVYSSKLSQAIDRWKDFQQSAHRLYISDC